jgi:hypothetical protein
MRSRLSRTVVSGIPTVMKSRALPPGRVHVHFDIDQMSFDAETAALRVRYSAMP